MIGSSQTHRATKIHRGFTLIEVMITVAILGILASIAYPAYTEHVRKGQIQEAFANLSNIHNRLEQYYQDHRRYAAAAGNANCGGAAGNTLTQAEVGGEVKYFTYTCTVNNNGQSYVLTATGSSGAATGNTYTIDQAGTRATTSFKGATSTANCWLLNGSC